MQRRLAPLLLSVALVAAGATGLPADLHAQESPDSVQMERVFAKQLPDVDYDTSMTVRITYPPGHVSETHKHPADLFAYVLEGKVKSKLKGQKAKTFEKGEMWWEAKGSVHQQFRNLSDSEPAKLLVIYLGRLPDK